MSKSYRDLIVWQRAIELVVAVYKLTPGFPRDELYGLTGQIRRASVSVASKIAEGYGRGTRADYKHFLCMSRGSNYEVQTQLVIARELGFGQEDLLKRAEGLSGEVGKMLFAIIDKLATPKDVVD